MAASVKINRLLLAKAEQAGRNAFRQGRSSAPALDPALDKILKTLPHGLTGVSRTRMYIAYIDAWSRGWHDENIQAPVAGWTEEENEALRRTRRNKIGGRYRNRVGSHPAGGDQRFEYVPFYKLTETDQLRARARYVHKSPHLPDEAYLYPVKKNGRLPDVRATRYMDKTTAERLYAEYVAVHGRRAAIR